MHSIKDTQHMFSRFIVTSKTLTQAVIKKEWDRKDIELSVDNTSQFIQKLATTVTVLCNCKCQSISVVFSKISYKMLKYYMTQNKVIGLGECKFAAILMF